MRPSPGKALVVFALLSCTLAATGQAGVQRGTHFDVTTPGVFVSSVDSSVAIDALVHATPRSFVMAVNPVPGATDGAAADAAGATTTRVTLAGLLPATAYYRYTDDFQHLDVVTSDDDGRHAFDLDLSRPHLVIVQPNPSTVHLHADGTGCPFIGTWEAATLTCHLRRDVAQTIEIEDDGVTLDGEGFMIDGTSAFLGSSAVMVGARTGVTVRDLVIDGAPVGVIASGAKDSLFENITMTNANGGFLVLFETPSADTGHNTFRNNVVQVTCDPADTPCGYGFSGLLNNEDTISGNQISGAQYGITSSVTVLPEITDNSIDGCWMGIQVLASLTAATIDGNTVTGGESGLVINTAVGCEVGGNVVDGATGDAARIGSRDCSVIDNTFRNSARGINVLGMGNAIVHNQFLGNAQQAEVAVDATGTLLSRDPRVGGNHWSDFDESAEGCDDLNADGYCDAPYAATGGQDFNPWATDQGWMDITPPTTGVTLDGVAGGGGWYRSAVSATFTASDEPGGSGVLRSEYGFDGALFTPAGGPVGLSDEGATNLFYRSIDRAGNAETAGSVEVRIDTVPPSVVASVDPAPNGDGWNKGPVTVSFTCADAHSGVASCPSPHTLPGEGAGQQVEDSASDVAGNTAEVTQEVDIDLTPPAIDFSGGCGSSALLNHDLSTQVTVTDALSGVASQSVPDGPATLATTSAGPHALDVTATDHAGNGAAASCRYSVIFDFAGGGGFQPPVDAPPIVNVAKAGSTVPVKWQIPDGLGGFVTNLDIVASIRAQMVACAALDDTLADPIDTTTSGASGLRYDLTSNQYIYNWKTTIAYAGRCYALYLNLSDGQSYRADFKFTR